MGLNALNGLFLILTMIALKVSRFIPTQGLNALNGLFLILTATPAGIIHPSPPPVAVLGLKCPLRASLVALKTACCSQNGVIRPPPLAVDRCLPATGGGRDSPFCEHLFWRGNPPCCSQTSFSHPKRFVFISHWFFIPYVRFST